MRLSDLLGTKVTTESGETVGYVRDLRGELTTRSLKITGLVVGGLGVLERLGITKDVVDWKEVVRADARGIVVRDDTSLR